MPLTPLDFPMSPIPPRPRPSDDYVPPSRQSPAWPGAAVFMAILAAALAVMLLASREDRIALRAQLACCRTGCEP